MDSKKNIDDLFRGSLESFKTEPSPGVWKKIERRFFGPQSYLVGIISLSILLILMSVGISAWFRSSYDPLEVQAQDADPAASFTQDFSRKLNDPVEDGESDRSSQINNDLEENALVHNSTQSNSENDVHNSPEEGETLTVATANSAEDLAFYNPSRTSGSYYGKSFNQHEEPWNFSMLAINPVIDFDKQHPALASGEQSTGISSIDLSLQDDYARPANLGFGAHVSPGVIFYEPNPDKKSIGLDFTANYFTGNWMFQAGIGGSWIEDIGKYQVDYQTYDSVGFFMEVVSFDFAKNNPDSIVPTMLETTVYDSVGHITLIEKNNRYAYFTVPIHAAYRIYNHKRFGLYLKGGIIYSMLVYKDEPTIGFNVPDATDVIVDRQVPARTKHNWQFTGGLQFSYRITDRFLFTFEPYYAQYLNHVYEQSGGFSDKRPFVIGIRTGIDFNLK
jgi:hypothetical protein